MYNINFFIILFFYNINFFICDKYKYYKFLNKILKFFKIIKIIKLIKIFYNNLIIKIIYFLINYLKFIFFKINFN